MHHQSCSVTLPIRGTFGIFSESLHWRKGAVVNHSFHIKLQEVVRQFYLEFYVAGPSGVTSIS